LESARLRPYLEFGHNTSLVHRDVDRLRSVNLDAHGPAKIETIQMRLLSACGYNLTGNVSGVCPECGTPVPPESEAVA